MEGAMHASEVPGTLQLPWDELEVLVSHSANRACGTGTLMSEIQRCGGRHGFKRAAQPSGDRRRTAHERSVSIVA